MHHRWNDVVFDISNSTDRIKYIKDGGILPLTHEADPLDHAQKCCEFRSGSLGTDGYQWSVWARTYLNTSMTVTADGAGEPHPDVNFDTL
ncbi:MAG TPA: hypothetical protein VKP30_00890, partial [Polyangiaceae bacterium]|nr:hypothetical protein [Polyangiaceae bacterium]